MKALLERAGYRQDAGSLVWSAPGYAGIPYSDGDEVENSLAAAIREAQDVSVLSPELRRRIHDWPSRYHLSSARSNLLRPFQSSLAGKEVLEIGAGCGAITRYLGEAGAGVLALEGSLRRAGIARSRTRGLANVEVLAETFDDFRLEHRFDVVTLIGVLEYANLYVGGADPFLAMLRRARSLLKPDGRLLLAIENKVGLKYFAGAREDHVGIVGYGIEDRYTDDGPRTFGHVELKQLLTRAGFNASSLFSPLPDYKLPVAVIGQEGWDCREFDAGILAAQTARHDPQLPDGLAFAPELAWPPLCVNGLGQGLSNSHLVVAFAEGEPARSNVLAHYYSTNRVPHFCKETRFELGGDGRIDVVVDLLGPPAPTQALIRFQPQARSAYAGGRALSLELMRIVTQDGWTPQDVASFMQQYLRMVLALCKQPADTALSPATVLPGSAFDLLPQNIHFGDGGQPVVIDQEWIFNREFTVGWLVFRVLSALVNSVTRFGVSTSFPPSKAAFFLQTYAALGLAVPREQLDAYAEQEAEVQAHISGLPIEMLREWGPQSKVPRRVPSLHEENARLAQELDRSRREIAGMRASRSWRITAPLRLLVLISQGRFHEALHRVKLYAGRALRRVPPGL
ncbi:class I SAM-dependent methyltransferase [Ramlibacter henchirensis]|uniref:Class I SAM-dependent methyltransferase n=1 Tax=Ramlibacter henchirensis TaxID=204072 RepID=A0A4Z0C3W7_9BURK|nr:class I SAM-dependent methyltransferase [Ramlibacter henchirensis]TFZ05158.1 class I SAM-dependent methyltransferase [Ramlibacter henchirensis]